MSGKIGHRSRFSRREFLGLAGLSAGALALGGCGTLSGEQRGAGPPSGVVDFELEAAPLELELGGRKISTWGYNGGLPGPEIRLKEGETLRATVRNRLSEGTSIHWHGVPLPNKMDGVPGVTQEPTAPGGNFTYEFEAKAPGTYIYHSHSGLQLDRGLYGPLIVEPKDETLSYDREFVLTLDDWLDGVNGGTPEDALKDLESGGSTMDGMEGMGDMGDMGGGNGDAPAETPQDVAYPLYLVNGKPANEPKELVVREGERVRIRLINPSGATIYRVALAGHRMTVTHADGQPVEPVEAEVVRIGMGERYDVIVEADNPGAWQLAARVEGAEDVGRAVFRYEGNTTEPPAADEKPPELEGELLLYEMLRAAPGVGAPPKGEPDEVVPLALGGDEETYTWTIGDAVFEETDRISVGRDRHVRFEFENNTMMPHPMHLHGHFFQVDNGTGRGPIKDTVLVEPGQKLNIDWVSDNPGDWAFHCHQAYHQEAGMMRVVRVA